MTAADHSPATEQGARTGGWNAGNALRRVRRWLPKLVLGILIGGIGVLATQWCIERREADSVYGPAPPPENPAVSVTLSHPLIAALIQRGIDDGESPIALKGIQADARNGRLEVRGTAELLGRNVPVSVELEPAIEQGVMRMRVRRSRLGPLPVPQNIERLAEAPLNRELAATLAGLPATLTGVTVTEGGLTVTADVRIDELRFAPR